MEIKMVINRCFGALLRLAELGHPQVALLREEIETASEQDVCYGPALGPVQQWMRDHRTDPLLIQVVEELGSKRETGASGECAKLRVATVDIALDVDDDDGMETASVSWWGWVD